MQVVGIAYAFEYTFQVNFKITVFLAALLFSSFIAIAGLRGSIYNSLFQFFVIILVVFITVPILVSKLGMENMFNSLLTSTKDANDPNYNLVGILIGIIAVALDSVSLLMIGIFRGILFAAPTAALILGLWFPHLNTKISFVSIVAGLFLGLAAFFIIPSGTDWDWFVGNMISLGLPFIIIFASIPFSKERFDYKKLEEYEPDHQVSTSDEVVQSVPKVSEI